MSNDTPATQSSHVDTTEAIKLFGTVLAMVISTATVNFQVAAFVNEVRDQYLAGSFGKLGTFSKWFNWVWGYLFALGIAWLFVFITHFLSKHFRPKTGGTPFSGLVLVVSLIFWFNALFWTIGFVVDGYRMIQRV